MKNLSENTRTLAAAVVTLGTTGIAAVIGLPAASLSSVSAASLPPLVSPAQATEPESPPQTAPPEPTTTTVPPVPTSVPTAAPHNLRQRIANCEGYPRFVNRSHGHRRSTASGKFGFLDSTWSGLDGNQRDGGWRGYQRAFHAPENIQDEAFELLYSRSGTRPWRASRHCWS